ncbi:MAG: hypothetical protein HY907_06155 [Deltaproteobacteria bacterium]|nr:hypothetical protein [Deltaproteobacteria bacterium]
MPNWTFYCWSCGRTTEMIDKVARFDVCPHCGADMHSCRNCEHWDPDRPERCCDESYPLAEDPKRSNVSSRFEARRSPHPSRAGAEAARARLDEVFDKKPK